MSTMKHLQAKLKTTYQLSKLDVTVEHGILLRYVTVEVYYQYVKMTAEDDEYSENSTGKIKANFVTTCCIIGVSASMALCK